MAVHINVTGGIAIIKFENGPVNPLAWAVRSGLANALKSAGANPNVDALVIMGANSNFSAGADIAEFAIPEQAMKDPFLPKLCDIVDACPKLVVAAIQGSCLGGGLELALCCDHRIAKKNSRLGFPEVRIGIIPGAGGTQRLPRLVGVQEALAMIVTGKYVNADRALKIKLLDAIVEGDLESSALQYVKGLVQKRAPKRRCSDMQCKGSSMAFTFARKQIAQSSHGLQAPMKCLEAVELATKAKTFDEGTAKEKQIFLELLVSNEAKALRYAFFAEREAWKIPGVSAKPMPIHSAAVIGAGIMGGGIAMCFAAAGIPVYVVEASQELLNDGIQRITDLWKASQKKGSISAEELQKRLSLLHPTMDYNQLANVDVVVEAVIENMALKKEIFHKLDAICKPSTILASNTSTLNINEMATATQRPSKVCGMHFFSPANVMRLLENVRCTATDDETLVTIMDLGKRFHKVCIMVGVSYGFLSNRMNLSYLRQTELLLEEGAFPEDIDKAIQNFGFNVGPCQMVDIGGINVLYNIRLDQLKMGMIQEGQRGSGILAETLYVAGRLGQKTGKGYYRYEKGSRKAIPDPEVADIIIAQSKRFGITRRKISEEEITQRLLCVLVNEACGLLSAKVATRPSDVDICWLYGFGFPPQKGGPLFWADSVGLPSVLENIKKYRSVPGHADFWPPCPLLEDLVTQGKTFASLKG